MEKVTVSQAMQTSIKGNKKFFKKEDLSPPKEHNDFIVAAPTNGDLQIT